MAAPKTKKRIATILIVVIIVSIAIYMRYKSIESTALVSWKNYLSNNTEQRANIEQVALKNGKTFEQELAASAAWYWERDDKNWFKKAA
jgi:hypothetical protein